MRLLRRLVLVGATALLAVAGALAVLRGSASARAPAPTHVAAVHFLNATTGWITTGNQSRLLMTTDGGRRWRDISPPALRRHERILAGGLAGAAVLSRDDIWVSVFNLSVDRLHTVQVWNSTDAGATWRKRGSFPYDDGNAWLYFRNRSSGWLMVGNGQAAGQEPVTIYRTRNGGASWSRLARSARPTAWAGTVGAPSAYCDKAGISFSSAGSGWVTGFCNGPLALQLTVDGGRRWRSRSLVATYGGGYAYPPQFFGGSRGLMRVGAGSRTGLHDEILSTSDSGARWIPHRPPGSAGGPADVLSAGAWFIASGNTLFVTRNGGHTWQRVSSSISINGHGPDALDFVSPRDGWTVTADGGLRHTTDGGRSWTGRLSQ